MKLQKCDVCGEYKPVMEFKTVHSFNLEDGSYKAECKCADCQKEAK